MNQNLLRPILLGAFAAMFMIGAVQHQMGGLARPGPGLFPAIVSGMLLIIAALMVIRARLHPPVPTRFNPKNIAIIIAGLVLFVLGSRWIGAAAGIVMLVLVTSLVGTKFSWKRNIGVSLVLILIAIAFQRLLGLNLKVI